MRIPIVDTDSVGIVQDLSPHNLPMNAWSAGNNVRMENGSVQKILGHKQTFTPSLQPRFVLPFQHLTGYWWLYAGDTQVAAYQNAVSRPVTRASGPYNATGNFWSGGVLNGIPVLGNASDVPQAWLQPSISTRLQDLPNWPANWRCTNIRPYKDYLVALGTNKGNQVQPYTVNWSHPAEPGTVPITWDPADETHDAGEFTLAATSGFLVNQLAMGETNIIYKEDSVYAMQYVGGAFIMSEKAIFKENVGLLMPGGLASFTPPGGRVHHIVFAANDIIIHDGSNVTSIFDHRMRKWLYNNLDSDNFRNSFIVNNAAFKELWVCFPLVGSTWPNCALIWNYVTNTLSLRDLPQTSAAAIGQINEIVSGQTSASWSGDNASWETDTSTWGSSAYQPVTSRLLQASYANRKMYVMDIGPSFEEEPFSSYIERTGITVSGQDKNGKPIEDSETVKLLTEIWVRAEGPKGTTLNVFVGVQDERGSSPTWEGPFPFIIGEDTKINPLVSGKILSVRFESAAVALWQVHGYDLNIVAAGGY